MPTLEIDPQKTYKMPSKISVRPFDNKILVISSETANWLLLHNDRQLEIFNALRKRCTVSSLLEQFPNDAYQDIIAVLVELEAKKFEDLNVRLPQEHGMYLYLTQRCNQRCRHCYMYAGDCGSFSEELTTAEIISLLGQFAKYGGEVVTLTGGEATMRSDFSEIVRNAKDLGLKVCVLSNGLLWDNTLIALAKDYIDEVQISIDGFDSGSYQSVRGVDTFDCALNTVDSLVTAGVKVTVAISPLLETLLPNQEEYIQFAKKLMKKYEQHAFLVKFNTELMEGRTIKPTEAENMEYRLAAKKIKTACNPLSAEENFALNHRSNTIFANCGFGGLCISSIGNVYFCSIIAKCAKQGNIKTDSFEEIMSRSSKARRASDVNNLHPCCECDLKYLCGGGCRVKFFKGLAQSEFREGESERLDTKYTRDVVCKKEDREKIYSLMIASNKLFYQ